MKLTSDQKTWLHDALKSLEAGCVKSYHDSMWLGFGDVWSALENHLRTKGAIHVRGRHGEEVALTALGEQLVKELDPNAPDGARNGAAVA